MNGFPTKFCKGLSILNCVIKYYSIRLSHDASVLPRPQSLYNYRFKYTPLMSYAVKTSLRRRQTSVNVED